MAESIPFELQSLADAHRYQQWLIDVAHPHLGENILELGSGIGNLSQHLPIRNQLVLSDIDPQLVKMLREKFASREKVSVLRLENLRDQELNNFHFDTIISFNVMEHVPDDSALLREGIELLRSSKATGPKRIVSIVPAHQWAFGTMDETFGHHRRYSDASFRSALERAGAKLSQKNYSSQYMNLPGLAAWWLNGRLLKKKNIGTGNMKAFELLCPFIRPLDDFVHKVLRLPLGNSLLAVYKVTQ